MARSRSSLLKTVRALLALAQDQADRPEGASARSRAQAIIQTYGLTDEEIQAAETPEDDPLPASDAGPVRVTIHTAEVALYEGREGGPAAWQIAALEWAARRYGCWAGRLPNGRAVVIGDTRESVAKAVLALRNISEAATAVASAAWNASTAIPGVWGIVARTRENIHSLPLDVTGWVLVHIIAEMDGFTQRSDDIWDSSVTEPGETAEDAPTDEVPMALAVRTPEDTWTGESTVRAFGPVRPPTELPARLAQATVLNLYETARRAIATFP